MYHIGICDDGKNTCAALEKMVLLYANKNKLQISIQIWYTGEELCKYLEQGENLDILFLDIELFELTGIDVGEFIRNKMENREMQIIYISGKSSYAQKLFKTQPLDFLIKPITIEQIESSLELAVKLLKRYSEKFEFQIGKDYFYISYNDILYFESENRKIKIVMADAEKEFYGKIRELEKKLPKEFLSIHRSYVINTAHVIRYAYDVAEMDNGTSLTISKAYRKQVREKLLRGQE
ncbi:MAG: LytTR family DNA-binding domain-containing protein [Lachnoclostridium sp.]|nr:LytTR family DNA-binding domain-containing protein [Lachnospira sp.]MCM1248042.1 LytTR family DNA-binding domain-containing protein [Lachnoclostridium sp.]MCM1535859.1 LytTR family DNA-binding domain-containing protein [Clostridium sp.]